MSGGGFSVSIPISEKRMIENIKEIAENNSDEEIYAMLKECYMDPDETIQKLLVQDPFHEVKSKRERRKENVNSKESVDSRRKASNHGRGGRGGSSNIAPRYTSNDTVGGRNSFSGKDNGVHQVVEKRLFHTKNKDISMVKSALPVIDVGPTSLRSENPTKINSFLVEIDNKRTAMPTAAATKKPTSSSKRDSPEQSSVDSGSQSVSTTPVTSSVASFSSSNSILVSSKYSEFLDAMSSTKYDNGTEQFSCELITVSPAVNTSIAETVENIKTLTEGNIPSKSQGLGVNHINEFCQSSTSANGELAISWASSNNVNRPQQIIGSQKVGFNKEWKPKIKNSLGDQGPQTVNKATSRESETGAGGTFTAIAHSQPVAEVHVSKEITKLEEKLENLHLPPTHLVILPDHIHVPDSERTKLSFGSFVVGFDLNTSYGSFPGSDKSPTAVSGSETSLDIEETSEEPTLSDQNALETAKEGDYDDHSRSPMHATESLSGEVDISSNVIQAYNDLKQDTRLTAVRPQYSVVHPLQDYGFGIAPQLSGSHLSPFENSDSQARDVSRLPSFVVHQSFDPTSYYPQYYRSGTDSDGRISPVPHTGVTTKYNGNVAMLTQSPQEGGVLSTESPTQATGQMQNSVAVTEPSVSVFRPPTGMHISHFPPNYIPYGHYFSPFYVPPPIHQLLGNNAFPHQPQAGSMYPTPLPAAAAAVKYSLPQYKVGTNSGNSTQLGIPTGYGPYGSTPSGYNLNSAETGGIAAGNEDIAVSSFKEKNVYITGPQSEGSAVWVAAPGREMSNLAGNSFYNLPLQGPHMTYTPTQAGHGTFASIYHPAQAAPTVHPLLQQSLAVAGGADMVGPGGNVYQQHSQTNWPINY